MPCCLVHLFYSCDICEFYFEQINDDDDDDDDDDELHNNYQFQQNLNTAHRATQALNFGPHFDFDSL